MNMSRRFWIILGAIAIVIGVLMTVDIVNNPEGPRSDHRDTPLAH